MARYWLGPWVWSDGWNAPPQTVALLDLRSVAACALAGTVSGFGLFITANATDLGSDYENLGTDPLASWGASARNRWTSALALPQALQANTLRGALWETLTIQADPTGEDRAPPLMPTTSGRYEIWLAGQLVDSKPFRLTDAEATPVIDLHRRIYRQARLDSLAEKCRDRFGQVNLNHYRKVLGYWVRKYGINYRNFQPADVPDEEPLAPETAITDNFNRSDADALGSSSEGWSWTEVFGDNDIVSNQATNPSATTNSRSRAESDLSSSDMYAQVALSSHATANSRSGPVARYSDSADTCYLFRVRNSASATYTLFKVVTGVETSLASGNATAVTGGTAKLTVNGSALEGFLDSVSKISVTDSAIASGTRAGIHFSTTVQSSLDDFEAADLAVAGQPLVKRMGGVAFMSHGGYQPGTGTMRW